LIDLLVGEDARDLRVETAERFVAAGEIEHGITTLGARARRR